MGKDTLAVTETADGELDNELLFSIIRQRWPDQQRPQGGDALMSDGPDPFVRSGKVRIRSRKPQHKTEESTEDDKEANNASGRSRLEVPEPPDMELGTNLMESLTDIHAPGAYAQAPGALDRRRPTMGEDIRECLEMSEFPLGLEEQEPTNGAETEVPCSPPDPGAEDNELVEAHPVDEKATPQVVAEVQQGHPKEIQSKYLRLYGALAFGLVLLSVIVVVSAVALKERDSESASDVRESSKETLAPSPTLTLNLHLPSKTTSAIIDDSDSPQAKAYRWLELDPLVATYSQTRKLQRFVLATLYYSTNGPNWAKQNNWLSYSSHECHDWFNQVEMARAGSHACNQKEESTGLVLNKNGLAGKIPRELGLLSSLEVLVLANNNLVGLIPDELWRLPSLKALALDSNLLGGSIEPELIQALPQDMLLLDLSGNLLRGSLPSEFGLLETAYQVSLNDNFLTGTIPKQLGHMTSMAHIALSANSLTGSIPPELFGSWGQLTHLELRDNALTGSVPSQIGLLTSLEKAFLYSCRLSGSIPSEMGLLFNLTHFVLSDNTFNGSIAEEIWGLPLIQEFLVSINDITGSIPAEIEHWSNLGRFWNHETLMKGTIPSELGLLMAMTNLGLSGTGTIPPQVWALPEVTRFMVKGNLTGFIPADGPILRDLTYFNISNSALGGTVPDHLCALGDNLDFNCTGSLCGCDCTCGEIP